eukprot:sb/3464252/
MCYNILAEQLATRTKYGYCPSASLSWEKRKELIMGQIRQSNADIIALQEVETDKFYNQFRPLLEAHDYEGTFCPKSRSKTLGSEEERKRVDGCAIFFKKNKFSLAKEKYIDYSMLAIANSEGADDMINRVQTKDNIGICCCLDIKEPTQGARHSKLIILNTHINWDPEYSDVKLIQNIMFMNESFGMKSLGSGLIYVSFFEGGVFRPLNHTAAKNTLKLTRQGCGERVQLSALTPRSPLRFSLAKEKYIDYSMLAIANSEGADDMINRVQTKDNIGICCCLDIKEPTQGARHSKLIILNTHINWDPEYSDVKLIQNIMFMNEVDAFVKEIKGSYNIPMVVCGDFNSTPDSAVIEFLLKSQISTEHSEFHGFKYHGFLKKANGECLGNKNGSKHFKHNFKLKSCYSDEMLENLKYTNYTYDFKGILDHILHSKDSLRTVGVLGGIDEDWMIRNKVTGCPNVHYPSDHLPIIAELELTNSNSR